MRFIAHDPSVTPADMAEFGATLVDLDVFSVSPISW
jgi:hypothetical protein